ncbi:MAG TPA: class I SAM-dependent methyltransferase [Chloroflexia bacterium]|nr:class I SAM-dependent methyltransferase [Chloroflexia bacterium]
MSLTTEPETEERSPAGPSTGEAFDYEAPEHVIGDYPAVGADGRRDFALLKVERALAALAGLAPGSLVLEVGCGAGATTRALYRARPDLVFHACDLSRTAIRTARALGGGIRYVVASADALPYRDASFDAVVLFDVLEHVPDAEGTLGEISRVLRPGALLAATVPAEGQPGTFEWLRWKIGWHADLKPIARGHVHRFTYRGLRAMLRRHGLHPVCWQYSFHILGQAWDFWHYYALHRWGGYPGAPAAAPPTLLRRVRRYVLGRAFGLTQRLGYWESRLLARVPLALTVDVACRKTAGGSKGAARTR